MIIYNTLDNVIFFLWLLLFLFPLLFPLLRHLLVFYCRLPLLLPSLLLLRLVSVLALGALVAFAASVVAVGCH